MLDCLQTVRDAFFKTIGVLAAITALGLVAAALVAVVLLVLPAVGLPVTNADRREQQEERDYRIVMRCTDAFIRKAPSGTTVAVRHDGSTAIVTNVRVSWDQHNGLPKLGRRYFGRAARGVTPDLRKTCPVVGN